jgi:AraC family transcriptional regulator, transcriptional activator FtrA
VTSDQLLLFVFATQHHHLRLKRRLPAVQKTTIVKKMPNLRKTRRKFALPHRVAVLAYEGLCTFEFGIAVELFGLPRPELEDWYEFEVCGLETGPLSATGGFHVSPHAGVSGLLRADTIVIPGWRNPDETPPLRLIRTLRKAHERGTRLMSICSGVFVLAATGLLDGKAATTHWRYFDELARSFPDIRLQPNVLYVDEGDVLTSAGSAAGIDLCLHLIRKDFGPVIANKIAQRLVLPPHREGGQAQFVESPVGELEYPWLSNTFDWVRQNLHKEIRVVQLADLAHMSKRTFARRFAETTGSSPLEWVTSLRIRKARDLLETTELPIESVAENSGFGSAPVLRHHFRKQFSLSPNLYRYRFKRY